MSSRLDANVCFTFLPEEGLHGSAGSLDTSDWPPPFVAGGRAILLCERDDPKVAILGYGLGAMAWLMASLRPRAQLIGVEPASRLFHRARRNLPPRTELKHQDALAFLRSTRRRHDLIVDDCFELHRGEPRRPAQLWRHAALAKRRLADRGLYVRNLLPESRPALEEQLADLRTEFRHVELRRFRHWENVMALASDRRLPRIEIRRLAVRTAPSC